ncbi:MAG: LysM peptidoglycan-binding domain-containing protein [Sphingobacteriales bacterium]|nr:MAG: LysM peptidoglycan-binding domain-containing protein [Sphingobacteriales bacterium]
MRISVCNFSRISTLLFISLLMFQLNVLFAQVTNVTKREFPKTTPADSTGKKPADESPQNTKSSATIAPAKPNTAKPTQESGFDYQGGVDLQIPDADEEEPWVDAEKEKQEEAAPVEKATAPKPVVEEQKVYVESQRDVIKQNKLLRGPITASYPLAADKIPEFTDEIYEERLKALPTLIPMEFDELVSRFISIYLLHRRDQIARMLPRTDHYYRIFEDALDRYGLPIELKYLPVIQSALIPHAKSNNGAGLWQLSYGTARLYGLEANSFIDERFDPLLSTEVAVQHLRSLYGRYRDWQLAIVAFNVGEGVVNKAIKRSGGRKDYKSVAPFLSEEAQSYIPLFTAAVYAMNYYPEHNIIKHDAAYNFYATDTVRVFVPLDLKEVSSYLGMPLEELQFLNPAIKRAVIPRMVNGFPVTLPVNKLSDFMSFVAERTPQPGEIVLNTAKVKDRMQLPAGNVWNYKMDEFGLEYTPVKIDESKQSTIEYRVKVGDSLGEIAETFDCTIAELKKWNKLSNNKISVGKTLIIKVPKVYEKVYRNIEARKIEDNIIPASALPEMNEAASETPIVAQYIFQQGDSLSKIAAAFNITKDALMRQNKLVSDDVKPGTTLQIPAPKSK